MNDRPEQYDWPEPVQDHMSDQDFAMMVEEMRRHPGYEDGRLQRLAKFMALHETMLQLKNVQPEPEQDPLPEPVQDRMSDQDFAMIVQEMRRRSGYEESRAQRIAAINSYRDYLLSIGPIPTNLFQLIRDDEDDYA